MADLTRRDLVQRGALLAGTAGAASIAGIGGIERALAAVAGPALSAERHATYSAVVEAVALSDKLKVHARELDRTTAGFAELYARSTDEMRDNTDLVLDLVERGAGGDGFTLMGRKARLKQLRRWLAEDTTEERKPTPATAAPVAIALAALPFYPDRDARDPIQLAV